MTKKLLHKTLRYYITFSLIVMLLAVPLFFISTKWLYLHEIDEVLMVQKEEFIKIYVPQLNEEEIKSFNKLNQDIEILAPQKEIVKDMFFEKSYYNNLDNENEPYRVLMTPVTIDNKPYVLFAKVNLVDNADFMFNLSFVFIILFLTLIVGLFFITKRLSVTLWKPFYRTLDQIEKFEIDKNSNLRLDTNNIEEFSRLNTAINKLIERNTRIYKSQKEFIENAAHELQTPIAIFKGKLETLIQRNDVTEEQFELLDKLNDTTSKLNRLNKNLLLLSKIESKQYNIPEKIHLNDVINKQLDFFKEQAMSKKITVNIVFDTDVFVMTNGFLAEILISNLFLNSINHNVDNGIVNINLTTESLIFSNTGMATSLETEKLFERFFKVNPSSKGNGLGLSIIKKIVENNNWNIIYSHKEMLHNFEIHF